MASEQGKRVYLCRSALSSKQEKEVNMEARAEHWLREHMPHLRVVEPSVTEAERVLPLGLVAGAVGAVALATPLVIYDWAHNAHAALELPAAATAWLFGLEYFGQGDYRWWPILIGAAILLVYLALHGVAFAFLEERLRTLPETLVGGIVLSFYSWLLFWYAILPIARDGAPFRETAVADEFVAPNWAWILGFTLFGVGTAVAFWALRRTRSRRAYPPDYPGAPLGSRARPGFRSGAQHGAARAGEEAGLDEELHRLGCHHRLAVEALDREPLRPSGLDVRDERLERRPEPLSIRRA
jgi:hypothetical protein